MSYRAGRNVMRVMRAPAPAPAHRGAGTRVVNESVAPAIVTLTA
jgi:hypothetical protein